MKAHPVEKNCLFCKKIFKKIPGDKNWAKRKLCSIECNTNYRYKIPIERFHSSYIIKENGCWDWIKCINGHGRGSMCINYQVILAPRYSYIIHKGEIPDGLDVCHTCDNGKCVNPDHLWLGTHKENMQDMHKKGRRKPTIGEDHPHSKLNKESILEIRRKYNEENFGMRKLAKEYKVSYQTISAIINYETWKHI